MRLVVPYSLVINLSSTAVFTWWLVVLNPYFHVLDDNLKSASLSSHFFFLLHQVPKWLVLNNEAL